MVDTSPGPGWWVASDGRWYPPELHPDIVAFSQRAANVASPGHAPLRPRVPPTSIRHLGRRIEGAPVAHIMMLERALRALDPALDPATDPSLDPARALFVESMVPDLAPDNLAVEHLDALLGVPTEFPVLTPATTFDLDALDLDALDLDALDLDALDLRPARVAEPRVVEPLVLPPTEVRAPATRTLPPIEPAPRPSTRRKVGVAVVGIGVLAVAIGGIGMLSGRDNSATPATTTVAVEPATTTPGVVSSQGVPSTNAAASVTTASTAPTTSAALTPVSVFSLTVGTCVNNPDLGKGLVSTLTSVPCDQPHTHEVFHRAAYVANPVYDAEALANFATQQCRDAFNAYVGTPYDQSSIFFLHLAPSSESWNQNHDREVACLLYKPGGLTTSAKDTKV
jgi:hypothetical protein